MAFVQKVCSQIYDVIADNDTTILSALGFSALALSSFELFGATVLRQFFPEEHQIENRYGKGSWVIITAATESTGIAFARDLAKKGFNLILLDKSEFDLCEVARELQQKFKDTKIRTIVTEYSNANSRTFFDQLYRMVQSSDVSMLINHIGNQNAHVHTNEVRAVLDCSFPAMLTRKLLPKLAKRPLSSAVILVSSESDVYQSPNLQTLRDTKKYLDFYSSCLGFEYAQKVDFVSVRPNALMVGRRTLFRGASVQESVLAEGCVKDAFKKLSSLSANAEQWRRQIWSNYMMHSIFYKVMFPRGSKEDKKRRQQEAQQRMIDGSLMDMSMMSELNNTSRMEESKQGETIPEINQSLNASMNASDLNMTSYIEQDPGLHIPYPVPYFPITLSKIQKEIERRKALKSSKRGSDSIAIDGQKSSANRNDNNKILEFDN